MVRRAGGPDQDMLAAGAEDWPGSGGGRSGTRGRAAGASLDAGRSTPVRVTALAGHPCVVRRPGQTVSHPRGGGTDRCGHRGVAVGGSAAAALREASDDDVADGAQGDGLPRPCRRASRRGRPRSVVLSCRWSRAQSAPGDGHDVEDPAWCPPTKDSSPSSPARDGGRARCLRLRRASSSRGDPEDHRLRDSPVRARP